MSGYLRDTINAKINHKNRGKLTKIPKFLEKSFGNLVLLFSTDVGQEAESSAQTDAQETLD